MATYLTLAAHRVCPTHGRPQRRNAKAAASNAAAAIAVVDYAVIIQPHPAVQSARSLGATPEGLQLGRLERDIASSMTAMTAKAVAGNRRGSLTAANTGRAVELLILSAPRCFRGVEM